jgi:YfiR/HmsC-like
MKFQQHISRIPSLIIMLFVLLFGVVPSARAIDQISVDNLQAAMRTLSFLESLPKEGAIVVGVVYPSGTPATRVLATETAKVIGTMRGPNTRMLQPLVFSTNDLGKFDGHLDVLFLVMGASKDAQAILNVMLSHRLVSISDDPACVDTKSCVLMVRTGQRVEVSLNTALADAVGARFSLVFTMVVKRK